MKRKKMCKSIFGRNIYVPAKFSCVRSSHDLCWIFFDLFLLPEHCKDDDGWDQKREADDTKSHTDMHLRQVSLRTRSVTDLYIIDGHRVRRQESSVSTERQTDR